MDHCQRYFTQQVLKAVEINSIPTIPEVHPAVLQIQSLPPADVFPWITAKYTAKALQALWIIYVFWVPCAE